MYIYLIWSIYGKIKDKKWEMVYDIFLRNLSV